MRVRVRVHEVRPLRDRISRLLMWATLAMVAAGMVAHRLGEAVW